MQMSVYVTNSVNVTVEDGPSFINTGAMHSEAYDVINMTIPHGGEDVVVDVQPSGTGNVSLLYMLSDNYASLTYTVDDNVNVRTFDAPLLLIGSGALALLGTTQKTFTFTNAGVSADAHIRIFVARTAEAEPVA
jgi:hypothetical protein